MPLTSLSIGDNSQTPGIAAELYVPDQLIAGQFQRVTQAITLGAGTLPRGSVLGQQAATGSFVLSVKTANDGSQVPSAILADFSDASGGPVAAGVYLTGEFNGNYLNYDPSWTLAALQTALRGADIFIKTAVSAAPPANVV